MGTRMLWSNLRLHDCVMCVPVPDIVTSCENRQLTVNYFRGTKFEMFCEYVANLHSIVTLGHARLACLIRTVCKYSMLLLIADGFASVKQRRSRDRTVAVV